MLRRLAETLIHHNSLVFGAHGHAEDRKTIRHPDIGEITVDCDVLNDSDTDLKIVIYTAAPGSEDQAKLDLARVAGTRTVT